MTGHTPWSELQARRRREDLEPDMLLLLIRARLEQSVAELIIDSSFPPDMVPRLLGEMEPDEVMVVMERCGAFRCTECSRWRSPLWINLPERVCEPCWPLWRETHPPVVDVSTGDHL